MDESGFLGLETGLLFPLVSFFGVVRNIPVSSLPDFLSNVVFCNSFCAEYFIFGLICRMKIFEGPPEMAEFPTCKSRINYSDLTHPNQNWLDPGKPHYKRPVTWADLRWLGTTQASLDYSGNMLSTWGLCLFCHEIHSSITWGAGVAAVSLLSCDDKWVFICVSLGWDYNLHVCKCVSWNMFLYLSIFLYVCAWSKRWQRIFKLFLSLGVVYFIIGWSIW